MNDASRSAVGPQHGDFDFVERRDAALRGQVEAANRLDLITKQLQPHRLVPIGGEQIDDSAARCELARQLHGTWWRDSGWRTSHSRSSSPSTVSPRGESPRAVLQRLRRGYPLHQARHARHDHAVQRARVGRHAPGGRCEPRLQLLERAQSLAIDLVVDRPLAQVGFPGREARGAPAANMRRSSASSSAASSLWTDDDQQAGSVPQQTGRQQRAGRPHDSVERGRSAGVKFRHGFGEAGVCFKTPRQVAQWSRRGIHLTWLHQ